VTRVKHSPRGLFAAAAGVVRSATPGEAGRSDRARDFEAMVNDKKGRRKGSSDAPPPDLRKERDELLQSISRGTRLTDELERLESRLRDLEAENAGLRAKVEADSAVRELLDKIDRLERDKRELLSRFHAAEAASTEVSARVQEIEAEFANLANLFVASNQLHGSLSPRGVMRRIKEVLAQLVGAERYCLYLASPDKSELVPIAFEGMSGEQVGSVAAGEGRVGEVFKSGEARVEEDKDPSLGSFEAPAAVVPLSVDEQRVGVIAIFSTLSQKKRFDTIDFELFKLLGQHAAAALVSASLFVQAERKFPGLEAFIDLSV